MPDSAAFSKPDGAGRDRASLQTMTADALFAARVDSSRSKTAKAEMPVNTQQQRLRLIISNGACRSAQKTILAPRSPFPFDYPNYLHELFFCSRSEERSSGKS
jgi:hypothetical protein